MSLQLHKTSIKGAPAVHGREEAECSFAPNVCGLNCGALLQNGLISSEIDSNQTFGWRVGSAPLSTSRLLVAWKIEPPRSGRDIIIASTGGAHRCLIRNPGTLVIFWQRVSKRPIVGLPRRDHWCIEKRAVGLSAVVADPMLATAQRPYSFVRL
jgi:hypothetical protein